MDLRFFCFYFFIFKHLDVNSLRVLLRHYFIVFDCHGFIEFDSDASVCRSLASEMAVVFRIGGFCLFDNLASDRENRHSLKVLYSKRKITERI